MVLATDLWHVTDAFVLLRLHCNRRKKKEREEEKWRWLSLAERFAMDYMLRYYPLEEESTSSQTREYGWALVSSGTLSFQRMMFQRTTVPDANALASQLHILPHLGG